jgi:hypothetical protein
MARPRFKPSEDHRRTVAQAYAMGMSQDMICELIRTPADRPISPKTLRRHFRKDLQKGRAQFHFRVLATAGQVAIDKGHKNFHTMNIWTQKTQLGITERHLHELAGPDGEPLPTGPQLVIVTGQD